MTRGAIELAELARAWRLRAAELRRFAAEPQAVTLECAAEELDAALLDSDDEVITLADAASRSGYNPDSLRRMHREGRLQAAKKGRRLFFRAGDLPIRPPPVDAPNIGRYNHCADARTVAAKRAHGE